MNNALFFQERAKNGNEGGWHTKEVREAFSVKMQEDIMRRCKELNSKTSTVV